MSFDGLFTHAMLQELSILIGGRITKIHQPNESDIIIRIRADRKNYQLLLSAHPEFARLHLTDKKYENPKKAPQFVMVLRKYMDRAIIQDIRQVDNDRIVVIECERRDDLGDLKSIYLIHEIMGRHSNLILTDREIIYDAIKHLPPSVNSFRTIFPGAPYHWAPKQDRINPFAKHLLWQDVETESVEVTRKAIQSTYQGFSRLSATELAERLVQDPTRQATVFSDFIRRFASDFLPTITLSPNKRFFTVFPYQTLEGERLSYESLSNMLDDYYGELADRYATKQKADDLRQLVTNALEKNQRKQEKLQVEMAETDKADQYRVEGEVLTAYMHEIQAGMSSISLPNFYADNESIQIQLDPKLTPAENAQKYFSLYNKLKSRRHHLEREIPKTEKEISYLDELLTQLSFAGQDEIDDIRSELIREGYLKPKGKNKKIKRKKSSPELFYASDGTPILVGKNNQQNDELTLRMAHKTDWWLHAKDIPGSHVVIRHSDPSEETFEEAAILAAHFSKYAQSSSVPIDTTQIKYVHKPNGAKPGYVIYENQRTLFVTPSQQIIDAMRKRKDKEQE